jgi:hypothetical protein
MGRAWLLISVLVLTACGAGTPPQAATALPATPTSAEPRDPIISAPAVAVQSGSKRDDQKGVAKPRAFPQSQAELDSLSYAERLSIARSAVNDLVAGRASRIEAYAPALSLVRSIPNQASEALEARDIARSLEAFKPSADEIIASTPPEQLLPTATYLVSQVFKDPTRTDLLDVAQKFISAIPVDLVVDQEQLTTVKNAILVLRVDGGSGAAALGQAPLGVPTDGRPSSAPPSPGSFPYAPPAAPAPCVGCPVHVREYTRRDGTTVHEHTRSAPRR